MNISVYFCGLIPNNFLRNIEKKFSTPLGMIISYKNVFQSN